MRTLLFAVSWLVLAGGVAVSAAAAAPPPPFPARCLLSMHRLTDPQPSPRGDQVVFVLRSTDFAANKGRNHLVRVAIDGGATTPLTSGNSTETNPRWSPDGKSL